MDEREMLNEQLDKEAQNWGYRDYQEYLSEATTVENNTVVEKFYDKLNEYYDPNDEYSTPMEDDPEAALKYYADQDRFQQMRDEAEAEDREAEKTDEILKQFFAAKDKDKLNGCKELGFVKGFYYMNDEGRIWKLTRKGPVVIRPRHGVYTFMTKFDEPKDLPEDVVNAAIAGYYGK